MPTHAAPFLQGLTTFLIPYFLAIIPDPAAARAQCFETLASYGARTRAEAINAVQIIAFSLTTLDTLAEAKENEMSLSMRLRYRGCANNLNRSAQQNEATLAKRQAADPPQPAEPAKEPVADLSNEETQQALQHVHAQIAAHRSRLATTRPANEPDAPPSYVDDLNMAAWTNAMIEVLTPTGLPAEPPPPA